MTAALNALHYQPIGLNLAWLADALPRSLAGPFLHELQKWVTRTGGKNRDRLFEELAGPMARAGLTGEARAAAKRIEEPHARITALAAISSATPEHERTALLDEAWDITGKIHDPLAKATVLRELLPVLDADRREEVARCIDLEALAAEIPRAAAEVVPFLVPIRTKHVLAVAVIHTEVLAAFVGATLMAPEHELRDHFDTVCRAAGRCDRKKALELLRTIAPWIRQLGGDAALIGVARSIGIVQQWWP
jgi:hypothetical protein